MTGSAQRPLLFLDVDGPIVPFGAGSQRGPGAGEDDSNPLLGRVDPKVGARLRALGCELVWATTWMADANECIAPRLGLPELEVVGWPEPSGLDEADERRGLHWKTRALVARAAGRAFVWVDDEITGVDRGWVAAHHRGPALLHRVDPRRGLTDADFVALAEWLRGLAGADRLPGRGGS
ncbi:HAD domain-containing protein [Kitasatospora azatica]|uniref:HAD domain-containing protein n=1 Tax=Kitasatospora azatica TaxID=58347 RepID=UPI0005659F0E|nr:HAD domain-containing protein [Kitasatospora azatica]